MRYELTPINTRPWLLNGLSLRLIESHYENHYGGALRRLNAITEQLESLDFDKTPGHVDAKYMKGGHSAWKAIGGPIKLYT
jgi:superoxide dismutase, Fe-Mn family